MGYETKSEGIDRTERNALGRRDLRWLYRLPQRERGLRRRAGDEGRRRFDPDGGFDQHEVSRSVVRQGRRPL